MSDEIMNTQTGQSGDLAGNDIQQNANASLQASVSDQSSDAAWAEREKQILAKAYQQAQSLVSKSENRQSSRYQSMIDEFKANYGVTLTEQQAQEMAQNQAAKSTANVPVQAQAPAQTAPATDPSYQGFLYYHGINNDSPVFRQAYDIQKMLGVRLEEADEEYQKLTHPETKYKPEEFIQAWKQACIDKMVRLKATQQPDKNSQSNTNMGQLPLVGSKGNKSATFDPKKRAKSYLSEFMTESKL